MGVRKEGGNAFESREMAAIVASFRYRDRLGNEFALHSEYNAIAEINNIIVLYPQIESDPIRNSFGCWDW